MEKMYVFADLRKFKSAKNSGSANRISTNYISANHKKGWGPQFVNLQSATFAKGPQI